jgi:hypothetical protein
VPLVELGEDDEGEASGVQLRSVVTLDGLEDVYEEPVREETFLTGGASSALGRFLGHEVEGPAIPGLSSVLSVAPARSAVGVRLYSEEDLQILGRIATLVSAGVSLEGVRRILQLEADLAAKRKEIDELRAATRFPIVRFL